MSTLTVNKFNNTGIDVAGSLVAADSGGDSFHNDGASFIFVSNGEAVPITVSVVPNSDAGCRTTRETIVVTIPAGGTYIIGPFPTTCYYNGITQITYTGVTTLAEIGVFRGQ